MRKLRKLSIRPRNPHIVEPYRLGQRVDVGLRAGEKVPAVGRLGMPVALHVGALLRLGKFSALARIDAGDDDVKVSARTEIHHLQRAG